jgi:hypothetical protein
MPNAIELTEPLLIQASPAASAHPINATSATCSMPCGAT